jgi:hypothetical protein
MSTIDMSHIQATGSVRREIRQVLGKLQDIQKTRSTRERSVAATKLEEAAMWLDQDKGKLAIEQSKNCGAA